MFQQAQCTTALRERTSQRSLIINGRNVMPEKASPSANTVQARRLQHKTHPQNRHHPFRIEGMLLVKRRCELPSDAKAESYCSTHPSFLRLRPKATTCSCNSRPALTCSENQSPRSRSRSDRTASCVFIDPLSSTGRTSKRSNPRRRESAVCVCGSVRRTTSAVDTPPICGCWLKHGLIRSRDKVCNVEGSILETKTGSTHFSPDNLFGYTRTSLSFHH